MGVVSESWYDCAEMMRAILMALALVAICAAQGPWEPLPDMPVARWEAGTVVIDNELYLFGGYLPGPKSVKRADVYNPAKNSWRVLAELPSAITHMNAVRDGRSVWLAGGFKDGYPGKAIDEVWRYDVDKDEYVAGPSLPEPRAGGGLALVGRRLHYIGGLMADREANSADHWVLDLESGSEWVDAAPMPAPRNQFSTLTIDGKIYLIAGQYHHDSGQADQPRVDVYHSHTDSWSAGPALPAPHSHAEGSTFIYRGRVLMMGGMTRTLAKRHIEDVIWALEDGEWSEIGRLPKPLSSPSAAIIGGKLILAGGSLNGRDPQPGMWVRWAP